MQKIVKEYSKTAWTDKDMIEFANEMTKGIRGLIIEDQYDFVPCNNGNLEAFKSEIKHDEVLLGSLEDTDTICVLIKGCKFVVAYDGDKCVIVSHTGIDIAETCGGIRNHARNYMKESNNNCWRAKSHAEAVEWLMENDTQTPKQQRND